MTPTRETASVDLSLDVGPLPARNSGRTQPCRILVVDDEPACLEHLGAFLRRSGYEVCKAGSSNQALEAIHDDGLPHLAIVDYLLPGLDGLELGKKLASFIDIPWIVMSARTDTDTALSAFQALADDFVTKPLDCDVLLARVKRLLARNGGRTTEGRSRYRVDDYLSIDLSRCEATIDGSPKQLSPTENKLLHLLMRDADQLVPTTYVNLRLWPEADPYEEGALRTLIYRLRRKIELDPKRPRYLVTRRGLGYCFGLETPGFSSHRGLVATKALDEA